VTGNYDDLGNFTSDISQLPRIVTLNDISISPSSAGVLTMDATAKTYRYLDEDELAAQNAPPSRRERKNENLLFCVVDRFVAHRVRGR